MLSNSIELPIQQKELLTKELKTLLENKYSQNVVTPDNQDTVLFSLKPLPPVSREIEIVGVKLVLSKDSEYTINKF